MRRPISSVYKAPLRTILMFWLETLGSRGARGVTASYFTGPLTLVLPGYSY